MHEIAFCTAVQNLSSIGQPWFFTFSWGPPFANVWIFWHWYFVKNPLKLQRFTKGGPHEKVKNQGCPIEFKFCTAAQNAILCTYPKLQQIFYLKFFQQAPITLQVTFGLSPLNFGKENYKMLLKCYITQLPSTESSRINISKIIT